MQWADGAGGKGVLEQMGCLHHPEATHRWWKPPPAKGVPVGPGREGHLSYISGTVCTVCAMFAWKLAQNKVLRDRNFQKENQSYSYMKHADSPLYIVFEDPDSRRLCST